MLHGRSLSTCRFNRRQTMRAFRIFCFVLGSYFSSICSWEIKSSATYVYIFIFFCRAKRKFFSQNLTLGYMTETLNQIIFFFLHQNQNILMVVPLAHVVLIGGKPWDPFVYFALCLVVIFLQSAVEKSNRLLPMREFFFSKI
jgi:hypothetical protein